MAHYRHKFPIVVLLVTLVSFASCSSSDSNPKAKYVFYFIGDGMGIQQVALTQAYLAAINQQHGNAELNFTQFPVTGFAETFSQNRYITGSAAAGTALSTGYKTSINTIGLNYDHNDTLYSVAHFANRAGYSVGVATSVSIDHATPAAFYAHQTSRNMYHLIAHDMLRAGYRFYGSGGFKDPDGKSSKSPMGNIFEKGDELGFHFTSSLTLSDSLLNNHRSIVFSSSKSASGSSLKYSIDTDSTDITLADITRLGIDVLMKPEGFFFMIEGGKIDWACHDNDAATTVHEMIAFADAIEVAMEFYRKYPNETLIVVTSDHETGGMSIGNREYEYESNVALLAKQKHSLEELNTVFRAFIESHGGKPTFDQAIAFLSSDQVVGLSFQNIDKRYLDELKLAYKASVVPQTPEQKKANKEKYGSNDPLAVTSVRILNHMAGIGWTSFSHTASHVPVYAIGSGQNLFSGQMDNTDIPKCIAKAMGLRFTDPK